MKDGSKFSFKIWFFAIIASFGGFLFGFNTSVISGALLFLNRDFDLGILNQELVVSTLLIGALLGALFGGTFADRFGRKKTLFLTTVLFLIGTFVLVEAKGLDSLLAGRFITGLAIGTASVAVPLYIAEISPYGSRGSLVSLNQLMITVGILGAYLIVYLFSSQGEWREMFGFAFFPLLLFGFGLLFIPESPSWKASSHAEHTAKVALAEFFKPNVKKAFWVGIGISVFQQITGINTVIYYSPQIFQLAGYQTAESATYATLLVGVVNVVMTVISLWLIDRLGRRPLLIVGLIGMVLSLFSLAYFFSKGEADIGSSAVISVMAYVAFFAISLGPVAWLIISEIYPLKIRGRAMGIATFANWASNYVVSLTFLSLIDVLSASGTFALYGMISLIALWFVNRFVPETKGKTFEEIQHSWRK